MEVFQAWYDYNATKPDELTIKVNDEVIVLDKSGGDWWLGRNRRTNEEASDHVSQLDLNGYGLSAQLSWHWRATGLVPEGLW